ncbi:TIGR03085 family metal-binding protein [Actinorugispora endophytica]|uniref:Uncharacterized protein (TIGR03085 family) n=1 Tax=Actinorugispora endophytica TaxID=1605990 RepID=A0A4R6UXS4_9ACTN|nr:TIGR03085 family metal-binding protein [Actinorugispora endophytica]TDQ50733.1 uncharacterized protein (TIGR03085 family) [Actinorugispora endophytica]
MAVQASAGYARSERAALCDLLTELGPDEPTLCTGWTTRDLATHLVVRERHPLAALGVSGKARAALDELEYDALVALVRRPPRWSISGPALLDRPVNTVEFFVHHEDVRRARLDWRPRTLQRRQAADLWRRIRLFAKLNLRRFPAAVQAEAPGYGRFSAGKGGPRVRIIGAPAEVALFVYGRQSVAHDLALIGPDPLVKRLSDTPLGP